MIPKLSAPLVKDIRTGEGILEWILGVADLLAGVTGNLSISHTVLYGTIIAAIKGGRRLLLKLVAIQKGAGVGTPLQPAMLGTLSTGVNDVLAQIAAVEQAATTIQSKPGTPAANLSAGLAPQPGSPEPGPAVKP